MVSVLVVRIRLLSLFGPNMKIVADPVSRTSLNFFYRFLCVPEFYVPISLLLLNYFNFNYFILLLLLLLLLLLYYAKSHVKHRINNTQNRQ